MTSHDKKYHVTLNDVVQVVFIEVCGCCGQYIPYVHHLGKDMSCAEHDALAARIADEFIKYGHT